MGIKEIFKALSKPLSPLNKICHKNPQQILVYSNLGFRDNVKAVFDYLIDNGYNKKYKIICSLNDYEEYSDRDIENVRFVSNIAGLRYFFTSKFMFYSFGKYPVKPAKNQYVINLWHGMPLKTIGNLVSGCEKNDYDFFTYTIATSEFFRDIMSKSFNCPPEKVLCTGQPRCDVLFDKYADIQPQKLILWLPTYRVSDALGSDNSSTNSNMDFPLIQNEEELDKLNDYLGKSGYTLLIKPHPLQNISGNFGGYSNIVLKTQADFDKEKLDLYALFARSDALITDYSSVYFDYLLLDRPIGFTLDDMAGYSQARGFVVDNPEKLMPGMKITSYYEFFKFIKSVCDGIDEYKDDRHEISTLANSHQHGGATKAILEATGLSI